MARLPYMDLDTAPQEVRETLDRLGSPLGIFRMVAHAEENFRPWLRLGASILGKQKLSASLRELVILRIGKFSQADYEYIQHVPIAKATGVSDAQIESIERGDTKSEAFNDIEKLILRFTDEVVQNVRASDATFKEMTEQFSSREIVEILHTISFYMGVARIAETTGLDIDPPAGMKVVDAAIEQNG